MKGHRAPQFLELTRFPESKSSSKCAIGRFRTGTSSSAGSSEQGFRGEEKAGEGALGRAGLEVSQAGDNDGCPLTSLF